MTTRDDARAALAAGMSIVRSPIVRSKMIPEDIDDLQAALNAFAALLDETEPTAEPILIGDPTTVDPYGRNDETEPIPIVPPNVSDRAVDGHSAGGNVRQPTLQDYAARLRAIRAAQVAKGYTPEHDDAHGVRHILNWAIDYARRGRSDDSAGLILAALEHLDRRDAESTRNAPTLDIPPLEVQNDGPTELATPDGRANA